MKTRKNLSGELLLEIGTEEIPSKGIPPILGALRRKAEDMLYEARIPTNSIESYGTPRRLVLRASGVPNRQEARLIEVTGPPKSAAYDGRGNPTSAATGFAKAQGVPVQKLTIKRTEKGEYVCATRKESNYPAKRILKDLLPQLISSIGLQKAMRWDDTGMKFLRPIRWIVAVYDGSVVPFRLAGLAAGNLSRGHRTMANHTFKVTSWDGYVKTLKRYYVMLNPMDRKNVIQKGLERLARTKKAELMPDPELLDQAVFLTEQPVVMLGEFEKKYLAMPPQILITAMKEHQGYFPLVDRKGKLKASFLFVSNIKTKHSKNIQKGNEGVLRARLDDARFYFEQDQKHKLSERVQELRKLVFHKKLGNFHQKKDRIKKLSTQMLQASGRNGVSLNRLERAAEFCKTDLLTGMVREFPTLQGIIGREYAILQGIDREVAEAIAEHYFPRYAEDQNDPKTVTGKFLTAADRIDTLVGFFGVDEIPSGSMDPYALRRHGMGLIQVFLDQAFSRVSLMDTIVTAAKLYGQEIQGFKKDAQIIRNELDRFLKQRMETYLRRRFEPMGNFRPDLVDAVLSRPFDYPVDLYRRYLGLSIGSRERTFEALMVTYKRADRIIPKGFSGEPNRELLKEKIEHELWDAYGMAFDRMSGFMRRQAYGDVLKELATLRQPIDRFFDEVLVMDPDPKIRDNRLALLKAIRDLFNGFADFSQVMVES